MRLKLFIVLGFGIMFVAGLEVGRAHTSVSSLKADWTRAVAAVTSRGAAVPATQPSKSEPQHLLFNEIELTASQDEQIHKIFHDARAKTDILSRQFHDLDRARDDEITALLDPQQRFEYDEIQHQRDQRVAELRKEISGAMEKAGVEVRALLTQEQQLKYDSVKKKFDESARRGGPNGQQRHNGQGHRQHPGNPDSAPSPGPETAPSH